MMSSRGDADHAQISGSSALEVKPERPPSVSTRVGHRASAPRPRGAGACRRRQAEDGIRRLRLAHARLERGPQASTLTGPGASGLPVPSRGSNGEQALCLQPELGAGRGAATGMRERPQLEIRAASRSSDRL